MKWADKRRAWSWRQLRLVRAVAAGAFAADPASLNPDKVLDLITDIAVLHGREAAMEEQLTAWEREHADGTR